MNTVQNASYSTNKRQLIVFITSNLLIALFLIYSVVIWNPYQLQQLNYPADSQGQSCYLAYPSTYPYLYIDLTHPTIAYKCVNQCPASYNLYTISDSDSNIIQAPSVEEQINSELGGLCWSKQKKQLMQSRGLYREIESKKFLMAKFSLFISLCIIVFCLGLASVFLFYCLPAQLILGATITLCICLIGIFVYLITCSDQLKHRIEITVFLGLMCFFLLLNIFLYRNTLSEAIGHMAELKSKLQGRQSLSLCSFLECLRVTVAFSVGQVMLLILLLLQYIALASNQPLQKSQGEIYYSIKRSCWKYVLLLCEWLFASHLLETFYQYIITTNGYHIATSTQIKCPQMQFGHWLIVHQYALLQTLFWIPLRFILWLKPQGAIIYRQSPETTGHTVSRACYCCCGLVINYLHRLTFNPFLALFAGSSPRDLRSALGIVQKLYHENYPQYDKTSLWLYRLSSYVNVSMLAVLLMHVTGHDGELYKSAFWLLFMGFSMVVSVQVCQYPITLWGRLCEVAEFVHMLQKQISNFRDDFN